MSNWHFYLTPMKRMLRINFTWQFDPVEYGIGAQQVPATLRGRWVPSVLDNDETVVDCDLETSVIGPIFQTKVKALLEEYNQRYYNGTRTELEDRVRGVVVAVLPSGWEFSDSRAVGLCDLTADFFADIMDKIRDIHHHLYVFEVDWAFYILRSSLERAEDPRDEGGGSKRWTASLG